MKYPGHKLAYAGAAAISAISILGGTIVSAQSSPSSTPTTPSSTTAPAANMSADAVAYYTALAANLNMPLTQLNAAILKTNLATIDAQVAAGKLTAAQATALKTRITAETQPMPFMGGRGGPGGMDGHGGPGGPGGPGGFHEDASALATFLGTTTDQLRTDEQSGKTLAEIGTAHGKTRDQLKTFLTAQAKTQLAAEVTAGRITQAQADTKLAEIVANLDARLDAKPGQHGPGGIRPNGQGGTTGATATGQGTN